MRIVGLTGGIACGKTAVSSMFRDLGAHLIDADQLAKEMTQPGMPAFKEILQRFPGVITPDGQLDRAALGDRVFQSPAELAALNAIVHPRVRDAFDNRLRALAEQGVNLVIYDVPLLFETKLDEQMEGVIVVIADPEVQLARLMSRNQLSREQALARIASQMPLSEKAKRGDWLIDNSGALSSTRGQVLKVWNALQGTPR